MKKFSVVERFKDRNISTARIFISAIKSCFFPEIVRLRRVFFSYRICMKHVFYRCSIHKCGKNTVGKQNNFYLIFYQVMIRTFLSIAFLISCPLHQMVCYTRITKTSRNQTRLHPFVQTQ